MEVNGILKWTLFSLWEQLLGKASNQLQSCLYQHFLHLCVTQLPLFYHLLSRNQFLTCFHSISQFLAFDFVEISHL